MKKWLASLVLLFMVSACSNQDIITFQDRSETWSVQYNVEVTGENEESTELRIAYVGDGEPPETIDYSYDAGSGSGNGTAPLSEDGVITPSSGCSGCDTTEREDEVTVTIEWDDQEENFTLEPRS
ncbi:hypothetical protein LCM20_09255 [Halobacillus litoralis]|uniref:hypothetical protein n=1 Tax=Halobacillus litoralis TaxID=45668 RepID=UPI001CD62CD5|nr:hypothetical protein [Halobacillus litoralis]MCA0970775.1 hypothetical protein [Halobacillus litoralis]